jgi:predicted NAD/FAD-dependent oxidoreductase
MFSLGDATLPARGMGEIARQLASQLPANVVNVNSPVVALDRQTVVVLSGEKLTAKVVILATEAPVASKLLGDNRPSTGQGVTNLYFAADEAPIKEPTLVLNGDGEGPINNLCVPSMVACDYAPPGKSLISLTCLGEYEDQEFLKVKVRLQLKTWFGSSVDSWQHLRSYTIPYALPNQNPPALQVLEKPSQVREGVYVCGDYCDTASINGAMASGRRAAESVLTHLQ